MQNENDEIELKLSKDEYKALVKLLYFADYCAFNGVIAEFKDSIENDNVSRAIEKVYELGINLNGASSMSLNSYASKIPFSEKEAERRLKNIEADLDRITYRVLAHEFAKRELNLPEKEWVLEQGCPESRAEIINEKKQPYLREFSENGISNLRFKLFYSLSEDDNE